MISLDTPISNTERKFGSADVYYMSDIKQIDGQIVSGLFTEKEVLNAIKRAADNPEDLNTVIVENISQTKFGRFMLWLSSFFGSTTRE